MLKRLIGWLIFNMMSFSACTNYMGCEKQKMIHYNVERDSIKPFEYIKEKEQNLVNSTSAVDTESLALFWNNFKKNIRQNNRDSVIAVLNLPIHAIFFVTFRFAYDCDTSLFVRNEKLFSDFDIDSTNVNQYFDFMFSRILKEMILQTSLNDLLLKGWEINNKGLTYAFFPRDYKTKSKCYRDNNLKFHIIKKTEQWKITISGL